MSSRRRSSGGIHLASTTTPWTRADVARQVGVEDEQVGGLSAGHGADGGQVEGAGRVPRGRAQGLGPSPAPGLPRA
ncbi:hypothetical protein [Streptomyces sp. NPDC051554]|uniref:hypothetical protein n=1 Tax=Streptomyces sp. NPDC051554 TaxID=3365656 RepID=UPI0037889BBE